MGDRKPLPGYMGKILTPEGRFLCCRAGDLPDAAGGLPEGSVRGDLVRRPSWMLDGSFMVFRKLEQDVSSWNEFLFEKAKVLGITPGLLGARRMGRWKSAHIRKTFPRNEVTQARLHFDLLDQSRIMRRGIPYGAELDADPDGKRGLLFVCYQSNLALGYRLIQRSWANVPSFKFEGAGLDSIIGQSNDVKQVDMLGVSPVDAKKPLNMEGINQFVIPEGGEYFFMPSMTALRTTLSTIKS